MKKYRSIAFGCLILTVQCIRHLRPTVDNTVGEPFSDSTIIDHEYALEASMLGPLAPDGTRNPILRANKGIMRRLQMGKP